MTRASALNSLSTKRFLGDTPRRRAVLVAVIFVLAVAIYAAGLRLAAPMLIERAASRYVAAGAERRADFTLAHVNPFTLSLELGAIDAADGATGVALTADRLVLNFGVASLLERRAALDQAVLERPALRLESPAAIDALGALVAELRIDRLEVRDGRLQWLGADDPSQRFELAEIAMTANDVDGRRPSIAAGDSGGQFRLSALDRLGTQIDADGTLGPNLAQAQGTFAVGGLDLDAARPWLGSRLGALALRGRLDLAGAYAVTGPWRDLELEIIDARAALEQLAFEPRPGIGVSTPAIGARASVTLRRAPGAASAHVELEDASFDLSDLRTQAPLRLAFADVDGSLSASTEGAGELALDLDGRLVDGGPASIDAQLAGPGGGRSIALTLTDLPTATLSPYAAESLGRRLRAGRADLALDYAVLSRRLAGTLEIVTRELVFERVDTSTDVASAALDVELAAALLEDQQGIAELDVPFAAGGGANVGAIVADALRARVAAIAAMPFRELGALVARDAETLRAAPFEPGAAGLGARALAAADDLAAALRMRPKIGLRVLGGFDANLDRDALAQQQIELHVLLATAGPAPQARPEPVDFASPRAQDVLDEFAAERLAPARVAAIADRLDCEADDAACREAYYGALFDALVANETITDATLGRLGRFRAQSLVDALVERGIAAERLTIGAGSTVPLPGAIGLPVDVHVHAPPAP